MENLLNCCGIRVQTECKEFVFNDEVQTISNRSVNLKHLNDADITTIENNLITSKYDLFKHSTGTRKKQQDSYLIKKGFL